MSTQPDAPRPGRFKTFGQKLVHSDSVIFTYLRSVVSSQICGWTDNITAFLIFSLIHLPAWLSTAIGAFVGGILNCIVNYRYTFHAKGVEMRVAFAKFFFVWAGSMLLNTFGTQGLYNLLHGWHWLHNTTGMGDDAIFLAARLTVAITVSILWNFQLQRRFVFRHTRFDHHFDTALCRLGIKSKKK